MSLLVSKCLRYSVAALLAAAASVAYAQTEGTIGTGKEDIQQLIEAALPPILTGENSAVAEQLLKPPLAPSLSETFKLAIAVRAAFGRAQPVFAAECSRKGTPVNEPDQGECNATSASPEGGGAFSQLSFSKNLGVGNIRFLSRTAFDEKFDPLKLVPVDGISDATALSMAETFLGNFGLPRDPNTGHPFEFPLPPTPAGAAGPDASLFVSNLAVAGAGAQGDVIKTVMIHKVVQVPRGLKVNLTDPKTQQVVMPFIPAPGVAKVLIDGNKQVVGAILENWQELRMDDTLRAVDAKTRQELVTEISQDLAGEGGRIAHVSAHIVYSSDWRGTFGLLLPAIQVYVAPATGALSPAQFNQIIEEKIGTAGLVREYALIGRPLRPDATVPGR
jgi:hypothetical protein